MFQMESSRKGKILLLIGKIKTRQSIQFYEMRKLRANTSEITSALFVLLFLYTSISKFKDLNGFASAISHSTLIGRVSHLLAWMIPSMEAVTVLLLFTPYTRYIGLIVSTILMALFTGYILSIFFFEPTLPCTCGGVIKNLSWKNH